MCWDVKVGKLKRRRVQKSASNYNLNALKLSKEEWIRWIKSRVDLEVW